MTSTARSALAAGRWTVDVGAGGLPAAITGSLDIGAIDTGNARRDKDLRKPGLLDLDDHPTLTFTADRVTRSGGGWSVGGHLTARGSRVRLDGDVEVAVRDGAAVLVAHTVVDRRALGARAPRIMIGHRVEVTVTATIRPPAN